LQQNLDKVKILSSALLEKEVLDAEDVKRMLGIDKKDLA
jgi:ATP-dependent Zn protease